MRVRPNPKWCAILMRTARGAFDEAHALLVGTKTYRKVSAMVAACRPRVLPAGATEDWIERETMRRMERGEVEWGRYDVEMARSGE